MFQRAALYFIALIASSILLAYGFHIRLQPGDDSTYRKLVMESSEIKSRRALERNPAHQKREGVQKDIWSGPDRLHFRLKSAESELVISQKKEKVEAVEKLKHIECWLQDEIDVEHSLQQIRTFSAETGVYHYPSHRFDAQSVYLAFFRIPGGELPDSLFPEKPFLTGLAREVNFSATSKNPTFTAYHLQAQLDPERGLP